MAPIPPFFVVGCARSGTTLVRVMLTAHPALAIPPESHFIVTAAPSDLEAPYSVAQLLAHPRVAAWGLDEDALRAAEAETGPRSYADAVRRVFEAYAASQGKDAWGDKTPGYVTNLPFLAALFPDARFLHVIRDGREVASSLAEWPWGPASAVAGGFWWRKKVAQGRRDGRALGARYAELRLEDLVADPEAQLRRVCDFLDVAFDPAMLDYGAGVERLMQQPAETWLAVTHPHLKDAPTAGLRDWRAGLSPARQRAVEAACGRALDELGYSRGDEVGALDVARAWVERGWAAVRTARRDLGARRDGARDV